MSKTVKGNPRKTYNVSIFRLLMLAFVFTFFVGAMILIVQGLGENFEFLPYISVNSISWGSSGDPVVIYISGLLLSIFAGSFIVLMIMRNKNVLKVRGW